MSPGPAPATPANLYGLPSAGDSPTDNLLRRGIDRELIERLRPINLAEQRLLPLTAATEHLLPRGGLVRGSCVVVGGGGGATTLALALASGPCNAGSWVACVGFGQLGWEAAEEVGLPVERLVAVRTPKQQWAKVVAALLDSFDVVMCGPEVVPTQAELRQLRSRARERESVLMAVCGEHTALGAPRRRRQWPTRDVAMMVRRCRWHGLGQGWGRLDKRRLEVLVEGRGELSRPRIEEVLIDSHGRPETDGAVVRRLEDGPVVSLGQAG